MPIDLTKLNTKLEAILSKNKVEIIDSQVYLPFKGRTYTTEELTAWLQERAQVLQDALTMTDLQLAGKEDGLYKTLSATDKLIANKIRAGDNFNLDQASDATAFLKLNGILLIKHITS